MGAKVLGVFTRRTSDDWQKEVTHCKPHAESQACGRIRGRRSTVAKGDPEHASSGETTYSTLYRF